jgi:tetratricopeptide (TPR) repeat protein
MIEPLLEAERLLRYGMLDRAEAIYRRVADEDPRNAFAFIGLARVASERGHDEEAYRFSAEAARIDPDNAVASALEARLGELAGRRDESQPTGDANGTTEVAPRQNLLRRVLGR